MKAKINAVAGVQLLLVGQVQATINQLQPARNISDDAVHAVRKYLKRARALLRLLRPALSNRKYHREKDALGILRDN